MKRSGSLQRRVQADILAMETGQARSSFGGRLALAAVAAVAVIWLFGLGPVSAQGASAIRTFDRSPVAPGGPLVVTIAVADYGSFGAVVETLPEGFEFVSSSHPADQITVDGTTLRFTLIGEASIAFTYTLTAPTTEGLYSFDGILRDADRMDHPIGGTSRIAVVVSTPGPTAEATPTPTAEPTPTPTATPTPSPTAAPTPSPTAVAPPTPSPTPMPAPTPTLGPPATATRTPTVAPTATPTSVPTAVATIALTPTPTAPPTPMPVPTVSVVPAGGDGMPAWVIPVVAVVALLILVAGFGVFVTSRQR